ncbi:hypothetical protein E2F47_22135 [Mycobacterium eburneum]|nr:hypothetical protein [Mycobacterium eburneum]TDH48867.1 hypothetical protein E2F47_22135 [Mycobacterium eburneum]
MIEWRVILPVNEVCKFIADDVGPIPLRAPVIEVHVEHTWVPHDPETLLSDGHRITLGWRDSRNQHCEGTQRFITEEARLGLATPVPIMTQDIAADYTVAVWLDKPREELGDNLDDGPAFHVVVTPADGKPFDVPRFGWR